MKIAIVGAGPAGAQLAHELSRQGAEVHLFDAREAWEKPCGGGVTSKALADFPFLRKNEAPKQLVSSLRLISAAGREVTVAPRSDFAIYSRRELGRLMRERAVTAGARLHVARVEQTTALAGRGRSGWSLVTAEGEIEVDLLIGADGASSVIRRRVGVQFGQEDFAYGLGWHVGGTSSTGPAGHVDVRYLDEVTGYLWLFPRTDHLAYGIASGYREATPAQLKAKLFDYIERQNPAAAAQIRAGGPEVRFHAAMIPALGVASWDRLRASDPAKGWALIGDAAGFVDPLTGEGIYYAIKSASLLAESLISGRFDDFESRWRESFGHELRRAAQLSDKFYSGDYAGASMAERMVQLAKRHRGVRETLRDLIAGDQGYVDLKERLLRNALRVW
jgi:geranylgeranyl reductase family protein